MRLRPQHGLAAYARSVRLHRRSLMRVSLLLAMMVFLTSSVHGQSPIIARVRADGIVLPYAAWTDSGWIGVQLREDGRPNVQMPFEWMITRSNGTVEILHPTGIVELRDGYDEWGIATDFQGPKLDMVSFPIERVGLASNIPISATAPVPLSDVQQSQLRELFLPIFYSLHTALLPRAVESTPTPSPTDAVHIDGTVVPMPDGQSLFVAVLA